MEGEERGSESHQDLVGLKKKRGGGGGETGNQLLGGCFCPPAVLAARLNLEGYERDREQNSAQDSGQVESKMEVKGRGAFPLSLCDSNQFTSHE